MPVLLVTLAVCVFLTCMSFQEGANKRAFKARCDAQQGTVLISMKSDGKGWIGCYSGVKEIPNEV